MQAFIDRIQSVVQRTKAISESEPDMLPKMINSSVGL